MSSDFTLEASLFDPSTGSGHARIGVRGGRISRLEIRPPADDHADLLRLSSRYLVVPGFVDAHTHLVGLGLERMRPDCAGVSSRVEALERVAEWLRAHPGSDPVVGEGWDQSEWSDPALPTLVDLDRISPDRPLALRRVCGHVAVFNSAALALLGTEHEGLDAATGLALEHLPLTISRAWPPAPAVMDEALRLGQEEAWRRGVTGIHEMGHPGTLRAFGRAQAAGMLRLRVTHFVPIERLDAAEAGGLVPGFGGDRLRVGGVKFFLDGSIGGRSAAVREPYPAAPGVAPGGTGMLLWEDHGLRQALEKVRRLDYAPAMHAIGDRAIGQAIAVVAALRRDGMDFPAPGPRIEHAEMLDAELITRGVAAGILFSMQPNFTARWQHGGGLYEQVLGVERARALNPYRAVADTGRLVFGSDTMPLDPLLGLSGATGHPRAEARLDWPEALRCYGAAAAEAAPHPFGNGRLDPGAPADFAVLRWPGGHGSPSPDGEAAFAVPVGAPGAFPGGGPGTIPGAGPNALDTGRLEVAATWFAGECVHADAAFRAEHPWVVPRGGAPAVGRPSAGARPGATG